MGKYSWSERQDNRREERRPKPEKKIYKIKPRTKEGAKDDRIYSELRKRFLEENQYCKANLDGCTFIATTVHHKKGRGIWLLITKFWLPACVKCHDKINVMPIDEAVKKGLSIRRID